MPPTDYRIRPATTADLQVLGRLGSLMLRQHHRFDPLRFMAPQPDAEAGYAWFLGTQLEAEDAAVYVAEQRRTVIGYTYVALEPRSWKELRDEAGFVHDVFVEEAWRGHGIGRALMEAAFDWCRSRGMPRVVLFTAAANQGARRLFDRLGFRETMIEMTRELDR